MKGVSQEEAIKANQIVHSAVSDIYDQSPHFREENKVKVKKNIKTLLDRLNLPSEKLKLLDMGCGTGFIIHLVNDLFGEIHGVDVTEAMIKRVDKSKGNITTHLCPAEKTPFANDTFSMVTAYTFLDHLADIRPFLKEVHRVLKPGGIFFSDLNPARQFWEYLFKIDADVEAAKSAIVQREIENTVHNDRLLAKQTGLDPKLIAKAESTKSMRNGFSRGEVQELASSIGFKKVEFELDWFMGQGKIMHDVSFQAAETVESYLRQIAPASDHLFKYLRIILTK